MKWEGKVETLQRCESQEGGGHSSLHLSASGGMSMPLAALEALSHFLPRPETAEHQWVVQGREFQIIHTRQLWSHFTCHLPPAPGPSPAPPAHPYVWPLECSRILRTSLSSLSSLLPGWSHPCCGFSASVCWYHLWRSFWRSKSSSGVTCTNSSSIPSTHTTNPRPPPHHRRWQPGPSRCSVQNLGSHTTFILLWSPTLHQQTLWPHTGGPNHTDFNQTTAIAPDRFPLKKLGLCQ